MAAAAAAPWPADRFDWMPPTRNATAPPAGPDRPRSRASTSRKADPLTALTITPTSSSVTGSSRPRRVDRAKTTATLARAPARANACSPAAAATDARAAVGASRHRYAASDAPLLTPSRYGSASGFRSTAW